MGSVTNALQTGNKASHRHNLVDGRVGNPLGFGGAGDSLAFLSRPLSGDGVVSERVEPPATPSVSSGVAGVMFRDSSAAGSKYAALFIGPDGKAQFSSRPVGADQNPPIGETAGAFFKLVRKGNEFFGYQSEDGVAWNLVCDSIVPLAKKGLGGFVAFQNNTPPARYDAAFTYTDSIVVPINLAGSVF